MPNFEMSCNDQQVREAVIWDRRRLAFAQEMQQSFGDGRHIPAWLILASIKVFKFILKSFRLNA